MIIYLLFKVGIIKIAKEIIKATIHQKVKLTNAIYEKPELFEYSLHNLQLQLLNLFLSFSS